MSAGVNDFADTRAQVEFILPINIRVENQGQVLASTMPKAQNRAAKGSTNPPYCACRLLPEDQHC